MCCLRQQSVSEKNLSSRCRCLRFRSVHPKILIGIPSQQRRNQILLLIRLQADRLWTGFSRQTIADLRICIRQIIASRCMPFVFFFFPVFFVFSVLIYLLKEWSVLLLVTLSVYQKSISLTMGITAPIIDSNKKTGSEDMNRKYEGSFASEHDGLLISVLGVLPREKPYRGWCSLCMEWRSIRTYLPFMEYLGRPRICGGDSRVTRGHGKSGEKKA